MAQLLITTGDPAKHIQTIKDVRAATGLGLREAKNASDRLRDTGKPQVILEGISFEDAHRRLAELRANGHADGKVIRDPGELGPTVEVLLQLADAIALARSTDLAPSEILTKVIG